MNAWPWDVADVLAGGEELRRLTGGTVFLLRPDAAVWYLATGLRNPTPHDYPLASPFGPDGQQVLAGNLASGRVRYCCWVALARGRARAGVPGGVRRGRSGSSPTPRPGPW